MFILLFFSFFYFFPLFFSFSVLSSFVYLFLLLICLFISFVYLLIYFFCLFFSCISSGITTLTMVAYVLFTLRVTKERTEYRRDMNRAEQKAAGVLSDSLTNSEAVRRVAVYDLLLYCVCMFYFIYNLYILYICIFCLYVIVCIVYVQYMFIFI